MISSSRGRQTGMQETFQCLVIRWIQGHGALGPLASSLDTSFGRVGTFRKYCLDRGPLIYKKFTGQPAPFTFPGAALDYHENPFLICLLDFDFGGNRQLADDLGIWTLLFSEIDGRGDHKALIASVNGRSE